MIGAKEYVCFDFSTVATRHPSRSSSVAARLRLPPRRRRCGSGRSSTSWARCWSAPRSSRGRDPTPTDRNKDRNRNPVTRIPVRQGLRCRFRWIRWRSFSHPSTNPTPCILLHLRVRSSTRRGKNRSQLQKIFVWVAWLSGLVSERTWVRFQQPQIYVFIKGISKKMSLWRLGLGRRNNSTWLTWLS